jgi:hypothetical protein
MKNNLTVTSVSILATLILGSSISPPADGAPLVTLPTSDSWYGSYMNVQDYVTSYLSNISPQAGLITDLTGRDQSTWSVAAASVQGGFPSMIIGTYHSSRDSETAAVRAVSFPPRAVPLEGLQSSQILYVSGNEYVVDYSQSAARSYLVSNILSDVLNTQLPLAFIDNVSSDEMGFPIPWSTTMGLISDLVAQLHAQGVRVIINAAWAPGLTSQQNVDALINSGVDGVSLEMPFLDPGVRHSICAIETAISQYRRMLDAGLTVIFISLAGTDPSDTGDVEDHLQAAFGLMFRQPGDKLFIAQSYWQPIPDWTGWPARLGAPNGNAVITTDAQGEVVITRQFANGSVSLNTTTRAVTVP